MEGSCLCSLTLNQQRYFSQTPTCRPPQRGRSASNSITCIVYKASVALTDGIYPMLRADHQKKESKPANIWVFGIHHPSG